MEYYTNYDIEHFRKWQYVPYETNNREHRSAGEILKNTVWAKGRYLTQLICEELTDFKFSAKLIWTQKGWHPTGERGTRIKPYTWTKLYRTEYSNFDIFFTFGLDVADGNGFFIYKIDCKENPSTSALSRKQINFFRDITASKEVSRKIPMAELLAMNYSDLKKVCVQFVHEKLPLYDSLIQQVWNGSSLLNTAGLLWMPAPTPSPDKAIKAYNRNLPNPDYEEQNKQFKLVGEIGEKLVKTWESQFLQKYQPNFDLRKASDSEGYDFESRDEFGNPKYIEVKTTTINSEYTPFYISDSEFKFMKDHSPNYVIYRLYNLDLNMKTAKFFKIEGDIQGRYTVAPKAYTVHL